ncbi:MAG TPA: SMP-30/gluconolactonase/LRE family protein [Candidatus Cloacimonadota bacterium]|nr:SMP-30/gluconolactonase/LRE family protein [Candidatus Cloacimonadota bacterium]HPS37850.1 SMP-30/gluconolactonase/LRE family protein [Candidatus Cloacimonadota bacterium]
MNKNKKYILFGLIALIILIIALFFLLRGGVKTPESIAFDGQTNSFLVSSTKGKAIYSMDLKGKLTPFLKEGFKAPRGILLSAPYLYVADVDHVLTIDLPSRKIVASIPVDGANMLNDIAMDETGRLFLTDTTGNAIFVLEPGTKKLIKLTDPLLKAPNGIVFDGPRHQMLVVSYTKQSPILSLDTQKLYLSKFMDTITSDLDGITIDDKGRIYFSSWAEQVIYVIPQEQNRVEIFKSELKSPADIYYHAPTNEILAPLWTKNKIIRFNLD